MKIAFDWDQTISRDPVTFGYVISTFADSGHDVRIVTWRKDPGEGVVYKDMLEAMLGWKFMPQVTYCNGKAKREVWPADVWVDDNPAAVFMSLATDPRIVADPAEYDNDILLLNLGDGEMLPIAWRHLKPPSEVV